ncbi:MAG: ABC transporter permease [Dehalococcoidia bacterium]|nr:ABC transporter permease [Dehalococcoidia bacterium]
MPQYLARRLVMFIPVLLGVSLLIFALMRVLPGDVALMILAGSSGEGSVTQEQLRTLRHKLGTDRPVYEQYARWIWGLATLDAGRSLKTDQPVLDEIRRRFPITLELAVLTAVIATIVSLPLGVISAIRQDTWLDYVMRIISIAGLAAPTFWIGTLMILAMVRFFNWIPPLGFASLIDDPATNIQQVIWPALALGYHFVAVVSRMTRSQMLEVMRQDYIRTAWSKGLRERFVIYRHALKNALIPVITLMGLQFAFLLGGTVIMETIFVIPGLGRTLVESITFRDYPMVQAIVMLFAVVILVSNLFVDLVYAWLDPRISFQG